MQRAIISQRRIVTRLLMQSPPINCLSLPTRGKAPREGDRLPLHTSQRSNPKRQKSYLMLFSRFGAKGSPTCTHTFFLLSDDVDLCALKSATSAFPPRSAHRVEGLVWDSQGPHHHNSHTATQAHCEPGRPISEPDNRERIVGKHSALPATCLLAGVYGTDEQKEGGIAAPSRSAQVTVRQHHFFSKAFPPTPLLLSLLSGQPLVLLGRMSAGPDAGSHRPPVLGLQAGMHRANIPNRGLFTRLCFG